LLCCIALLLALLYDICMSYTLFFRDVGGVGGV